MAKQRYVNTRFWRDNYILGLKPDARLLFLWAITNPETELCGAYQAAESSIQFETGLSKKRIFELFEKFESDKKILYRDGWVVVMNFTRHQNGTSTNIKKGAERTLSYCPDWVKDTLSTGIYKVSVDTLPRPRPKPKLKPSEHIDAGEPVEWVWPIKPLVEAFPEYLPDRMTPAMIGFIEGDVTPSELNEKAWAATIRDYQMNFDPLRNRYLPDKIANILSVFRKHKAEIEGVKNGNGNGKKFNTSRRHSENGNEQSTDDYLASIGAKPKT